MICSKRSFTGSQSIFSNPFRPTWILLFKFKQMVCIYFGIFAILNLIFCLSWSTKLSKRNRNGAVLGSYKATCEMRRRQEPVFSIWKSESTINFVWNFQSHWLSRKSFIKWTRRSVTVWYFLMCISSYLMSNLLTLLRLSFVSNSIHFVLSSPK